MAEIGNIIWYEKGATNFLKLTVADTQITTTEYLRYYKTRKE